MSGGDYSNTKRHGNTGHDAPDKRSRGDVRDDAAVWIVEVEKQVERTLS